MVRTLLLLRHAKSDHPAGVEDHDRPLNKRGNHAARDIGAYLAKHHLVPSLILSSTSERTKQTTRLMLEGAGVKNHDHIIFSKRLYLSSPGEALRVINELGKDEKSLMVVGHNPCIQQLVTLLFDKGNQKALLESQIKFPTAALAIFEYDAPDWTSLEPRSCKLVDVITPSKEDL